MKSGYFMFLLCRQPSSSVSLSAFKTMGLHDPPVLRPFQINVPFRFAVTAMVPRPGPGIVRLKIVPVSRALCAGVWFSCPVSSIERLNGLSPPGGHSSLYAACGEGMLIAPTAVAQSGITLVSNFVPGTGEQPVAVGIDMLKYWRFLLSVQKKISLICNKKYFVYFIFGQPVSVMLSGKETSDYFFPRKSGK